MEPLKALVLWTQLLVLGLVVLAEPDAIPEAEAKAESLADPIADASANPERSILDSGFSRTANFLMKTAMKLPPHILPTLNELEQQGKSGPTTPRTYDTTIGFYLPEDAQSVGVYMPKPFQDKSKREAAKEALKQEQHRSSGQGRPSGRGGHRPRHRKRKRPLPSPHRRSKAPFKIPFDPKKPMNVFASLGSRIRALTSHKFRLPGPSRRKGPRRFPFAPRNRNRGHRQPGSRRPAARPQAQKDNDGPYVFEEPTFDVPEFNFGQREKKSAQVAIAAATSDDDSSFVYEADDSDDDVFNFYNDYDFDFHEFRVPGRPREEGEADFSPDDYYFDDIHFESRPLSTPSPAPPVARRRPYAGREQRPRRKKKAHPPPPPLVAPPASAPAGQANTAEYVPDFVKELLANALLKDPKKYIHKLRTKQQQQQQQQQRKDRLDIGKLKLVDRGRFRPRKRPFEATKTNTRPNGDQKRPAQHSVTEISSPPRGGQQFEPSLKLRPTAFSFTPSDIPGIYRDPDVFDAPPEQKSVTVLPVPKDEYLQKWHDPRQKRTTPTPKKPVFFRNSLHQTLFLDEKKKNKDFFDYEDYFGEGYFEHRGFGSPDHHDYHVEDYSDSVDYITPPSVLPDDVPLPPIIKHEYRPHKISPYRGQLHRSDDGRKDEFDSKVVIEEGNDLSNTICICCDRSSSGNRRSGSFPDPVRRTLRVDDDQEMKRLITEQALIEEELDCSTQDPVEVVLVFGRKTNRESESTREGAKKKRTKHNRNRARKPVQSSTTLTAAGPSPTPLMLTPPFDSHSTELLRRPRPSRPSSRDRHTFGAKDRTKPTARPDFLPITVPSSPGNSEDENVYYDPTKLSFIFSTPSPLRRKYIEIRDKQALAGLRDDEHEVKSPKMLLQESQKHTGLKRLAAITGARRHQQGEEDDEKDIYFPASSEAVEVSVPAPEDPGKILGEKSLPETMKQLIYGKRVK